MNNNYSVLRAKDIIAILDGDFFKLNIPNYHARLALNSSIIMAEFILSVSQNSRYYHL